MAEPVVRGGIHAWGPEADVLPVLFGGPRDPDWVLTRLDCEIVKYDGKVWVGRVDSPAGRLYLKRYNVRAPRLALAGATTGSPARRAAATAARLAALGFAVPRVVAAVERRRFGLARTSVFVTHEVPQAEPLDVHWRALAALEAPVERQRARRALARALGALFARLHAAGVYHNDLKDVNLMAAGVAAPTLTLLDLERVRVGRRPLGRRRRVKNLVQLDRTLGRRASRSDRLRMLIAYLGTDASREDRRALAAAIARARRQKERGRAAPGPMGRAPVSCAVVCQDEAPTIGLCLAGVRWCEEVVVVDGGSRDDTVTIARAAGARVLEHAWPGYRAQKQFAFDHTTRPWIFSLDADERVVPELAQALQRRIAAAPDDLAGVAVARLVPYLGRWWFRGGWYPRPMPRLVRRGRARWGGTDPHDRLEVAGRVERELTPILHYTYADVTEHVRSVARLTATAVRHLPPTARAGAGRLVVVPLWRFVRSLVLERGGLEGLPGVFVAATDAFYAFLRWASVWARRRRAEP